MNIGELKRAVGELQEYLAVHSPLGMGHHPYRYIGWRDKALSTLERIEKMIPAIRTKILDQEEGIVPGLE